MKGKIHYLQLLFVMLLFVVSACGGNEDDITPPEPETPAITVPDLENLRPVLNQEGGTVSISFTTTADWTASLVNTRAESWIIVTPSSGSKGKNEITITTTANETYDERNATVVLKCGSDSKNIVVTQKQKDALTVTSSKYEVDSKGGNISVEVKANINFEVEVKADWIKQQAEKTRALTTSNLNFTIEPNETGDKREGEIIIKSGELSETIKVYQGFKNFITLTKKDFTIPEEGGSVDIEIKSTLGYEVKMLPDVVDWITEVQSRAVSTHTHHYTVSPNDTYDSREVKIVFYDPKDKNVADTVTIYQLQKDAIVLAQDEYIMEAEGGELDFTVSANVEFKVSVSADWIEQISTRGLIDKRLKFVVKENTSDENRETVITISNDKLEQHIKVIQKGKNIFSIKQKEYTVSAVGEHIQVEVTATGKYSIQMPEVDWITEVTTRSVVTNTHVFTIAANEGYDERSADIIFINEETGKTETVKVIQKQLDAIIIEQDAYTLGHEGGTLNFTVKANVDFQVSISADWIRQINTRNLTEKALSFVVAENATDDDRKGTITISYEGVRHTIGILQKAKAVFYIKQKEYTVEATGGEIHVEVVATGKYTIRLPEVSWITEATTRSAVTNTHVFTIAANEGYDERSADIVFTDNVSGKSETVRIIQEQQDLLVVPQEEYTVKPEKTVLDINVDANIEFAVMTSDNWIQQIVPRSVSTKTLRFEIAENDSEKSRIGNIILQGKNISRTITIKQSGKDNTGGGIDDMPTQPW